MAIHRIVPIVVVRGFLFLGALVPLGILACDDEPAGPESIPPNLTVTPSHQWAGGEVGIEIVGKSFEDGDVVVAGTDTLEVVTWQQFRITFRLPTSANGPTTLTVLRDGETLGRVTAEAFGFEEYRTYPVRLEHYITEVPVDWGVSVVSPAYYGGNGDTSKGFVWIHPSSGMHRQFSGTPDLEPMYRTGVDPVGADIYFEYDIWCDQPGVDCKPVHVARVVGGELVDLGWVNRPCQRWGCEPLAGDIWLVHEYLMTCKVVRGPAGDICEPIETLWGDDPQWIRRLWSADIALIEHVAFRMSTGQYAYTIGPEHLTGPLWTFSATTDEGRGLFYICNRAIDDETESLMMRIRTVRGEDGAVIRSVDIPTEVEPDESGSFPGSIPDLGYDQARDVLLIHRTDTWVVEFRDPVTLELKGEVALPDHPDGWMEARILVDPDTDHAFIVYSAAWKDDGPTQGTPVVAIRLPPM